MDETRTILLPCPFCGGHGEPRHAADGRQNWIECTTPLCHSMGANVASARMAVVAWNRAGYHAAPAPGVGEGPREMTFLEACEARLRMEVPEMSENGGPWVPFDRCFPDGVSVGELARLVNPRVTRYRLKPEPLPAPAPRVSRVVKMVREEAGFGDGNTVPLVSVERPSVIAERVVKAVAEYLRDRGYIAIAGDVEREFLEPR